MSPSASIGPHTRITSVNGGGPVRSEGTVKINGMDSTKGFNRVYPHIDDLTSVRPDVDINSPIRKILQDAELLAKQADTHLDFRRPDIALQEYLKASILVAEVIPRHKDYPSLQTSQGDLHKAHTGLVKRIKGQDARFDAVIKAIKENNLKSGVHATQKGQPGLGPNGGSALPKHAHSRSAQISTVNGTSSLNSNVAGIHDHGSKISGTPGSESMQGRKKPPVQPKPEALHGKALPASTSTPTQSAQTDTDLAARFARLRSLQPQNVTQDSRIRTQPIIIPNSSQPLLQSPSNLRSGKTSTTIRPLGPRELPSVPSSTPGSAKAPLEVQIPGMPKPPDAIYSPAGNTDSNAINLPSSISRNSSYLGSGKNSSAPPISKVPPTPVAAESMPDYFSPAHKGENSGFPQNSGKIPDHNASIDTYISAESLFDYLGMGSQAVRLLLVDLRSRELFDRGHIMAQSIICLEPISMREGISADEIGESIVLSPDLEQKLYEKRDEFDIVIFYDQSSSSIKPQNSAEFDGNKYLERFSRAVYDYGYEKQLKRRPMLLRGGLDAWVDLMGPGSLKSSTVSSGANALKPSRPLGRVSIARDLRRNPPRIAARQSRPFSKDEEAKWDETLKDEMNKKDTLAVEDPDSEEFSYARTTEDFLRKYPELPSIQESMVSITPRSSIRNQYDEFDTVIPRPPARPAPALPRQRSSGISEKGPTATYAMTSATNSITSPDPGAGLTGLNNPAVTCYVNSMIQCLSASPGLRQYLIYEYTYPQKPAPPKKADEHGEPPQLLTRNLANLLRILWSGKYDWVMPKTFLGYVNALYAKKMPFGDPNIGFCGNVRQHDAQEFLSFIFGVVMDELNIHRDKPEYVFGTPDASLQRAPIMDACTQEWKRFRQSNESTISDQFSGLTCTRIECTKCSYKNRIWNSFQGPYPIYFPPSYHGPNPPARVGAKQLLEDSGNFGAQWEDLDDFKCETCGSSVGRKSIKFAYLPEYLILYFSRFGDWRASGSAKIRTQIDFSSTDIDMTPFHITVEPDIQPGPNEDAGFQRWQTYEVYAAAMHQGTGINGGHYETIARNPDPMASGNSKKWHIFNDKLVNEGSFRDLERLGFQATVIFLKRKSRP